MESGGKNNPTLTNAQGEEVLRWSIAMIEKAFHALVGPDLNPNQLWATVSLVFYMGSGNFRTSHIQQWLLRDDHDGAVDTCWQWRRSGSDRRILPGLVERRELGRAFQSRVNLVVRGRFEN